MVDGSAFEVIDTETVNVTGINGPISPRGTVQSIIHSGAQLRGILDPSVTWSCHG